MDNLIISLLLWPPQIEQQLPTFNLTLVVIRYHRAVCDALGAVDDAIDNVRGVGEAGAQCEGHFA